MSRSVNCNAPNCTNNRNISSNLALFRVPKDPVRSKEWIKNSGLTELLSKDPNYLYNNVRFCTFHFEDSQFMNHKRKRLISCAVPTLFNETSKSNVGITEANDHQTLINHNKIIHKSGRTFLILKKLSMPKQNSLLSSKPVSPSDEGKWLNLKQYKRQSPGNNRLAKPTNNKVDIKLTLPFQDNECQSPNIQTGTTTEAININLSNVSKSNSKNETSNPKIFVKKLETLQEHNLQSSGISSVTETSINQIHGVLPQKEQGLFTKNQKAINHSSDNRIANEGTDSLSYNVSPQENNDHTLVNLIETEKVVYHNDETADINENVGDCIEVSLTSNTTELIDVHKSNSQTLSSSIEIEGMSNLSEDLNIQESEGQSSKNSYKTSSNKSSTETAEVGANENLHSSSHIAINETRTVAKERSKQDEAKQPLINCPQIKEVINSADPARIQENKEIALQCNIETDRNTNTTEDEILHMKDNEAQPLARHHKVKRTMFTTESEINQYPEEGVSCTNLGRNGNTEFNDDATKTVQTPPSRLSGNGTEENMKPTCDIDKNKNKGDFIVKHIGNNRTTSVTIDGGTQSKAKQVYELDSSRLLSSEKDKCENNVLNHSAKSTENTNKIVSSDLSPKKLINFEGKVVKRKLSASNEGSGKIICLESTTIKRKSDASNENKCRSSIESIDDRRSCIKTIKTSVAQGNPSPKTVSNCSSLESNKTKGVKIKTDVLHPVKIGKQKTVRKSLLRVSLNQEKNYRPLGFTGKGSLLRPQKCSDSPILSDDFSQYKQRVEAFKEKLYSPDFQPVTGFKPRKNKFGALRLKNGQSVVMLGLNKNKYYSLTNLNCEEDLHIRKDLQNVNCVSSVKYNKTTLSPTSKLNAAINQIPLNVSNELLMEKAKYVKKIEAYEKTLETYEKKIKAYEKVIDKLKTERKIEVHNLKKNLIELRKKNRYREILITKLRNENKQLKESALSVNPKTKPNFQRDGPLIENVLSKYLNKDTLCIVMSQVKNGSYFKNRWDNEVKMFALNIFQTSSKAYKVLRSYLNLPTVKTLNSFFNVVDIRALSGLNNEDLSENSEGDDDNELNDSFVFSPIPEDEVESTPDLEMTTVTDKEDHENLIELEVECTTELETTTVTDKEDNKNLIELEVESTPVLETTTVTGKEDHENSTDLEVEFTPELKTTTVTDKEDHENSFDLEKNPSLVHVQTGDLQGEIIHQYCGEEINGQIFYLLPETENECEVITEGTVQNIFSCILQNSHSQLKVMSVLQWKKKISQL